MTKGFFVTGTDTGVGKTLAAAALIRHYATLGQRVVGMKPVASGCQGTPEGLRSEDALILMREATAFLPYPAVNPYAFEPAIAPHLAAAQAGVQIDVSRLASLYETAARKADIVIVEGAGGWRVPLGPSTYLSDLPERLGLEIILVVGLRLGCLNHAFLTAEAIAQSGRTRLAGWIGNRIDPVFPYLEENVATLRERLPAPCLGIIPPLSPVTVALGLASLTLPPP